MRRLIICILPLVGLAFSSTAGPAPRLENVNTETGYHALVKENSRNVEITPSIRVVDAKVCSFLLTNRKRGEAPFQVRITDVTTGKAELEALKDLNCEKHRNYKFDIAAVGCDGQISDNITVHLTVEDVNEFPPHFLDESYQASVNEGRLYDKIIQVKAVDKDCTPKNSEICKYEILDPSVPFEVDTDGNIHNTEPLSWDKSRNYIFEVTAYDCSMKRSKPVTVSITINRVCHLGWKGVQERVEYTPGSGQRILFPDPQLKLCDTSCQPEKFTSKLSLSTHHIGKGCDRDTYSVESQRKICGASSDSVDLLPSPGIGTEWTQGLPTDDGHESDQIYEFDGATNAVVIPESTLNHNLTNTFTVAFWMRHEPLPDQNSSHVKEHIICNSDDHRMNRHHTAVFVRNCRLILLLRREPIEEQANKFSPAEWRWKLPEVCDNQWHHYAVSVNFPEASLYVDGKAFKATETNPEIVDDWPLHPTKNINATFVVGACWQGKDNKMSFHFHGYLTGLSVLRSRTESPEVLACLHRCKEGLEGPPQDLLAAGTEVTTNSEKSEVTLVTPDQETLQDMLSRISYVNTRDFPTPGRRSVKLTTTVQCLGDQALKVPSVESFVLILQSEQPTITINGTPNLAREYEPFKQGIELFSSISITVGREHEDEDDEALNSITPSSSHKLDSCTIQVYPPLNPDHERFQLPSYMMAHLGIHHKESKDGLVILGADKVENYELVLRQILYFNNKPAYYLNRAFKLVCSELNGRFVSNEYVQTLTVIHPRAEPNHEKKPVPVPLVHAPAHAQVHDHKVEIKEPRIHKDTYLDANLLDGSETIAKTSASHAVTIIIVVCVGFLVFMIVLGVIRIRAAHHRAQETRDDDQEMAWDDSSLTITVNPMDQIVQEQEQQQHHEDDDDSDSSDDGSSYHDEGESEDEEPEKVKAKELEWDDSTLNF